MDAIETLLTRRSVRKFTDQNISDEELRVLLDCAMSAPSACNEQPWEFLVLRAAANRELVSRTTPYTHMAAQAPLVIVVCGNLAREKAAGFWPQDCSCAIENMMLAARAMGIGSVWCGVHPMPDREEYLKKAFNLPESIIPFGIVCLGYPDRDFHKAERFNEAFVHHEKW